ncbi:MAG: DHHA1 domain-containing protein [Candidatus Krumholzibacteria bacterium]|nr:DHHA1 domain-containing protein [Candidatus Krumholzibacteria bacterium]
MNFDEQCYLRDPYKVDFSARVREIEPAGDGLWAVFLDGTFFYPESGGQPDDRGTLGGKPVAGVSESEKGVRHLVGGELQAGSEVEGHIDWTRRFDHMQQHSGQHVLSRAFLEGFTLKTVSFHLGEEICTIDLEGNTPDEARLNAAEARANEIIFKNIPVSSRIVGADELGSSGALRSRLPEGVDRARIVEIGGFDASTCCGTHVRATGEIGSIKILGAERVRGNTRVEFVCGGRAARDYAAKHKVVSAVAALFTTDWREIPRVVGKLGEEGRELRRKNEELGRELAGFRAAGLSRATASAGGFDVVKRAFDEGDASSLRETVTKIREMGGKIVLFGVARPNPALIFACSSGIPLNVGEILKSCAAIIGARGGGGKDFAQGGGGDGSRIAEALDAAEARIKEALG